MKYGDERCNTLHDGADVLVSVFIPCSPRGRAQRHTQCYKLRDALRFARDWYGDRRPRVKLSWHRMSGANSPGFDPY